MEMGKPATNISEVELVMALGRTGQKPARPIDAKRYPPTVGMQAKFPVGQGLADYRKLRWIAEPPNDWVKNVSGCRAVGLKAALRARHRLGESKDLVQRFCLSLNIRRVGAMHTR